MCAVCAPEYFLSWSGDACEDCGVIRSHLPTIIMWAVVLLISVAVGAVIYMKQDVLVALPCALRVQELYAIGENKVNLLFFMCQVIASYSSISRDTGEGHPESAASFANALSATNLGFLHFVPFSCVVTGGLDVYWKTLINALLPLGVITLLFLYPLTCWLRGKPYTPAARTAGGLALLGLEIVTPSVLTSVLQIFSCHEFSNGWFLRAELIQHCDGSMRRIKWAVFAVFGTIVYLVGEY